MRNDKLPALAEALSGMRFGPQHAHAAASLLRATDLLEAEIRDLQERVTAHLAAIPASWGADADGVTGPEAGRASDAAALPAADRLDEIPGLGKEAAAALIAEIGLDMSRFPTPDALVSQSGLTPTARQSGPRKSRGKKGHGNTYAKRIVVLAAYAAANTGTFLGERFRRLASRPGGGGRKKAGCAVGRSILVIVWHLLNDRAARFQDLGSDWHARHTDRSRKARNAQRQLEALGYDVIITLREDAA
jgi:transposase